MEYYRNLKEIPNILFYMSLVQFFNKKSFFPSILKLLSSSNL